ncbi:MAG: DUF3592 domain-containing protein [Planctomycetota bacterium]|nr:DUF3592 domain-containing protein [Planctomycetota bacterium]
MKEKSRTRAGFLVLVARAILSFFGCWVRGRTYARAKSWPTAPGMIVESSIESGTAMQGESWAEIRYTYSVAGVEHTSSKISYMGARASPIYALQIVEEFPVGQEVLIHYDPRSPLHALLDTGAPVETFVFVCAGIFLGLVALILFGLSLLRPARPGPVTR